MKLSNEKLATAAEIKAELMGRVFFNVGPHMMLSYFFINGQHIVAFVGKFWKSGVVDSVGGREYFQSESDALAFIQQKAIFLKNKTL